MGILPGTPALVRCRNAARMKSCTEVYYGQFPGECAACSPIAAVPANYCGVGEFNFIFISHLLCYWVYFSADDATVLVWDLGTHLFK